MQQHGKRQGRVVLTSSQLGLVDDLECSKQYKILSSVPVATDTLSLSAASVRSATQAATENRYHAYVCKVKHIQIFPKV